MEGKAVLFKRFADVDSIDLEIDTENVDEFINCVRFLGPSFGGINLEDIKAPDCFVIESRLRELMDIPVFHAGTAIRNRDRQVVRIERDANEDAADLGELHRIADDVEQNLAQPRRVEAHILRHVGRYGGADLDTLFMRPVGEHLDDAFQKLAQRFRARVQREAADLDGGEIEQILDELRQRVAGLADIGEIILLLLRQPRLGDQMRHGMAR